MNFCLGTVKWLLSHLMGILIPFKVRICSRKSIFIMKVFISCIYVNSDGDPKISQMTLAQYIREVALLTGTKVSCNEGGCGACIITVNKEGKSRSVNSVSSKKTTCLSNFKS